MANAVSFKANKFKGKTDIMVIAMMSVGGSNGTLTRCSIQLWLPDDPVSGKKKFSRSVFQQKPKVLQIEI